MKQPFFSLLIVVILCGHLPHMARAQEGAEHLSPFARGAAGTYSVTARGLDALGLNPGLLGLESDKTIEISVFPVSSFGVDAGPSFSQLNTVSGAFNGKQVTDSVMTTISDLLLSNKLSGRADGRVFGLSYTLPNHNGRLALNWSMHAAIRTSIPDSLLNFLGANAISKIIQGRLSETRGFDIQGLWYAKYGVTYSRPLLSAPEGGVELVGGLTANYVSGIAYTRLDPDSRIAINYPFKNGGTSRITLNYKISFAYPDQFDPNHLPSGFTFDLLTNATAGSGFGVDAGLVLGPRGDHPSWRVGASITDIGQITWTKHTDTRSANADLFLSLGSQTGESLADSIKTLAGTLDTTDAPFTSKLPTTLHLGASLNLAGLGIAPAGFEFSTATEYALGLTDVIGAPTSGRFGLAFILERPSPNFSFHTALGVATQEWGTDVTLGAGVGIMNTVLLDMGTSGIANLFKNEGHADAAFSLRVQF